MRGKIILIYWLPAIVWASILLAASSDLFSAQHTGSLIEDLITRILGHPLPRRQFDGIHFVFRKGGHLTAYFLCGALWFRALRGARRGWKAAWAAGAVLLALCVAVLDEWHQFFVPSRTGTMADVVLDCVGACLAQVVLRANQKPEIRNQKDAARSGF